MSENHPTTSSDKGETEATIRRTIAEQAPTPLEIDDIPLSTFKERLAWHDKHIKPYEAFINSIWVRWSMNDVQNTPVDDKAGDIELLRSDENNFVIPPNSLEVGDVIRIEGNRAYIVKDSGDKEDTR